MKKSSDNKEIREQVIGLGTTSIRKSYYREFQQKEKDLLERNKQLEEEIERRKSVEEILIVFNEELEQVVKDRTLALEKSNESLKTSLIELGKTQKYLIETEKLASLGALVTGISHEINTPLGVGITTMTYLKKLTERLNESFSKEALSKTYLESFFKKMSEGQELAIKSITRSAELLNDFKKIASDQTLYKLTDFCMYDYIQLVINSLDIQMYTHTEITIVINGSKTLILKGYPGILGRLISIFVSNSLMHGFTNQKKGLIEIEYDYYDDYFCLKYSDNGCGINGDVINRIFDPFFTTARNGQTSGLGLYSAYNLVTGNLGGTIKCTSEEGKGMEIVISIPKSNMIIENQNISAI